MLVETLAVNKDTTWILSEKMLSCVMCRVNGVMWGAEYVGAAFVSLGCLHNTPWTGRLKTTGIYFPMVLEAKGPKSRGQRVGFFCRP